MSRMEGECFPCCVTYDAGVALVFPMMIMSSYVYYFKVLGIFCKSNANRCKWMISNQPWHIVNYMQKSNWSYAQLSLAVHLLHVLATIFVPNLFNHMASL